MHYQQMVFNVCLGFVHSSDDANDLTQDVFIEVFNSIHRFKGDSKISTWLYRIAVNKSLNFLRSKKRSSVFRSIEQFWNDREEQKFEPLDEVHNDADYNLQRSEDKKIIRKALDELPKNQKTAFILSKYQEMSYKEISEIMELSISSIESLLFRAKQNLQKKLKTFYHQ